MDNDLNTAQAITVLYDVLKSDASAATKCACIAEMDTVLSLNLIENAKKQLAEKETQEIPEAVKALVEARAEARKAKDFAKADALRDEIAALGFAIRETRQGTELTKI